MDAWFGRRHADHTKKRPHLDLETERSRDHDSLKRADQRIRFR
jgi:hypothetical protein